jgi:PEP-CTERM/exosortase A-associated glycosyltransferase
MKILHILDHSIPLHSGYAFRTRALLKEQEKCGWDTVQLTSIKHYGAEQDKESIDGLIFYRTFVKANFIDRLPVLNQIRVIATLVRRMTEVVKNEKPDIIHAHSPCLNGIAALRVGKKFHIPVIYEVRASWEDAAVEHGSTTKDSFRYRLSRSMETYVLRNVQGIATICQGLKQDILSRGIGNKPIAVIPNAVDSKRFVEEKINCSELIKHYRLENKKVLGFIGSFYAYEGVDLLIRATAKLAHQNKNVITFLVGGGPEERRLKNLVNELGINTSVIFIGRVPHEEVDKYYQLIDVLVYARKACRLTDLVTPLKPLESMAANKVFIASNVGGHRELIPEQLHKLLFEPGDVDSLVEKILQLETDQSLRRLFEGWTREHVMSERSWQKSVANYRSLYKQVIN